MIETVSHNPIVARPEVSVLDWALLSLLQAVRADFVDKVTARWSRAIVGDGATSDEKLRFMHNLDCALKLELGGGESALAKLAQLYNHWDDREKRQELARMVDENGHRLFNSYYYITIDSYGEPGEYFFFPVEPGRSSLTRGTRGAEAIKFNEYLSTLDLPFQLRGRFSEYSGTLLPGAVGLTPQLCAIAKKRGSSLSPTYVPHFLGDLAILGKAEDAAQRHLSAFICPFVVEGSCLGAFLLTSSVPGAFSYSVMDREIPIDNLQAVVDRWVRAPLATLHATARSESRDAKVSVVWPRLEAATTLSPEPLHRAAEVWLHGLDVGGAAALLFSDRDTASALVAVNPDSLAMSLKSTLAPGPLLAPAKYVVADFKPVPAVSSGALHTLASELNNLCGLATPSKIVDSPLFREHLKDFAELAGNRTSDLMVEVSRREGVCVAVLYDGSPPDNLGERLARICDSTALAAAEQGTLLPGERYQAYPRLEAAHHRAVHGDAEVSDASTDDIYQGVEELLGECQVVGVLLFQAADIFIADACVRWHEDLSAAIFNPASYWVFEQICQLATMSRFPTERVSGGSLYFNPAPFVSIAESGPIVRVGLSGETDVDCVYISALNYLGVPVERWVGKGDEAVELRVRLSEPGQRIAEFYRGYLGDLLRNADRVKAIERAIESAHGKQDAVRVLSVEVSSDGPDAETVNLTFKALRGTEEETQTAVWRRTPTQRLEFAAFDAQKLSRLKVKATADDVDDQEVTASAWYPRDGWVPAVGVEPEFRTAFDSLAATIEEKSALLYKKTRDSAVHESSALISSLEGLLQEIEALPAATSHPLNESGSIRTRVKEVRRETDLFRMQLLDVTHMKEVFPEISGLPETFTNDFMFLAGIAVRQGIKQAADALWRDKQLEIQVESWETGLLELTKQRFRCGASLAFHPGEQRLARVLNILTVVRLLSNNYKHSLIDLAEIQSESIPLRDFEEFKNTNAWSSFAEHFKLDVNLERLDASNACANRGENIASRKEGGTFEVINQYLNHSIWPNGPGNVSRLVSNGNGGLFRFEVTIEFPHGFWWGERE